MFYGSGSFLGLDNLKSSTASNFSGTLKKLGGEGRRRQVGTHQDESLVAMLHQDKAENGVNRFPEQIEADVLKKQVKRFILPEHD